MFSVRYNYELKVQTSEAFIDLAAIPLMLKSNGSPRGKASQTPSEAEGGAGVASHDLRHLCSVQRTTGRRVDHLGSLAEILRTYRSGRDHAERLHVLDSAVNP
jgi:hypothetical protein